jgi:hypothetical protein
MTTGIRVYAEQEKQVEYQHCEKGESRTGSDVPHGKDEIVVFSVKVLKPVFPDLDERIWVLPPAAVGHVLHERQRDEI